MASYRKKADRWYYRYVDENGRQVERVGSTNKRVTQELAAEAEDHVSRIKAGLVDPRLERYARESRRPIAEHLADFAAYLAARAKNPRHARTKSRRLAELFRAAGVSTIADVSMSGVQAALSTIAGKGLSIQTQNHYLDAAKMFSLWAFRDGRAQDNPIQFLSRRSPLADRRRVRRSLSVEECRRLIESTAAAPEILDMPARERVAVYLIALGTGFRAQEILSLRPEWFRLSDSPPRIVVPPEYTKNGRKANQFIPPWLARSLGPWLAEKPAGERVFGFRADWLAPTLRTDLKLAGIAPETTEGVLDFHSLRGTYTNLFMMSGASIKQIQRGARHADIKTTAEHYLRADDEGMGDAMIRFPDLRLPSPDGGEST